MAWTVSHCSRHTGSHYCCCCRSYCWRPCDLRTSSVRVSKKVTFVSLLCDDCKLKANDTLNGSDIKTVVNICTIFLIGTRVSASTSPLVSISPSSACLCHRHDTMQRQALRSISPSFVRCKSTSAPSSSKPVAPAFIFDIGQLVQLCHINIAKSASTASRST